MTKDERRAIREGFRTLDRARARDRRDIERAISRLDWAERENNAEVRAELKALRKELGEVKRTTEETNRHAKFTSATIVQLQRSLEKAGVIGKLDEGKSGTAYSQVVNPKGRDRR